MVAEDDGVDSMDVMPERGSGEAAADDASAGWASIQNM